MRKRKKIKCLFYGYNGENNTGAESRLVTIIEDIKETIGKEFELDLAAIVIDEKNVRRYIPDRNIRMIEFGTSWPLGIKWIPKFLKEMIFPNDILIIVEGSAFTEHFSPFMLYSNLFAILMAKLVGCKVVCYAVDCGELSPFNQKITAKIGKLVDLFITRTYDAKEKLIKYGLKKEIYVNTDTAFQYIPPPDEYIEDVLKKINIENTKKIIGICPKEFFWWPVTIKLFGKKEDLYRYPYYHTWPKGAKEKSLRVKKDFAKYADFCVEKFDVDVLIIAMEKMDLPPSLDIYNLMNYKNRARVISSNEYNLKDISGLLSKIDFLVSTRYHACVLSMVSSIPMIAVSHDVRLYSLFKETRIMDYYIEYNVENLYEILLEKTQKLIENKSILKEKIKEEYKKFLERCLNNRKVFKEWFVKNFK
jgi:polysaccharide pyruvyl transferase WcaK-like protein